MKKITFLLSIVLIISCKTEYLSKVPVQNNHFNHEIFEENKLPPRATFFSFESQNILNKEQSKRFFSLNGDWKFNWVKDPKKRPTTFQNSNFDDSQWKTIPVPANWEVEGFGHPIYLDERYPFSTTWPNVPEDYNPVGTYRKEIELTQKFLSEDIILKFEAAKSAMYVYINGKYVGYSQGSKTPAEFSITNYIKTYSPDALILEDTSCKFSRKGARGKQLLRSLALSAKQQGVSVYSYSREDIRLVFEIWRAKTKYEIAEVIAKNIKGFEMLLYPKPTYPNSQKYLTALFDAVSLGITHYYKTT